MRKMYRLVILLICIFPKITMAENEFFCENGQELINGGCYKYFLQSFCMFSFAYSKP